MEWLPPLDGEGLIVPIFLGANNIDIGVNFGLRGSAGAASGFSDLLRQCVRRWRRRTGGARAGERSCRRRSKATEDGNGGNGKGWRKVVGGKGMISAEKRDQSIARQGGMKGPNGHQIANAIKLQQPATPLMF